MKKLKKINLFLTVIGVFTFITCSILQIINMDTIVETGTHIMGLNELTYWGIMTLSVSALVWLILLDIYIFTEWNWLKTETIADDIAAMAMFIMCIPILFSLTTFVLYDMINWYNWYTVDNYGVPTYQIIYSELRSLEREMAFWFIFLATLFISSGLAIFLYRSKKSR